MQRRIVVGTSTVDFGTYYTNERPEKTKQSIRKTQLPHLTSTNERYLSIAAKRCRHENRSERRCGEACSLFDPCCPRKHRVLRVPPQRSLCPWKWHDARRWTRARASTTPAHHRHRAVDFHKFDDNDKRFWVNQTRPVTVGERAGRGVSLAACPFRTTGGRGLKCTFAPLCQAKNEVTRRTKRRDVEKACCPVHQEKSKKDILVWWLRELPRRHQHSPPRIVSFVSWMKSKDWSTDD